MITFGILWPTIKVSFNALCGTFKVRPMNILKDSRTIAWMYGILKNKDRYFICMKEFVFVRKINIFAHSESACESDRSRLPRSVGQCGRSVATKNSIYFFMCLPLNLREQYQVQESKTKRFWSCFGAGHEEIDTDRQQLWFWKIYFLLLYKTIFTVIIMLFLTNCTLLNTWERVAAIFRIQHS